MNNEKVIKLEKELLLIDDAVAVHFLPNRNSKEKNIKSITDTKEMENWRKEEKLKLYKKYK